MLVKLILWILLINAASFIAARLWWDIHGDLAATLEAHISDPEDPRMTYLIAGNQNQADAAFDFMRSEFGANYTFVQFSRKGWSAESTAERIAQDVLEHDYDARVFTISLGDHAARYLEKTLGCGVEIWAINPCPNRNAVQQKLHPVLRYATPAAEVACHAIGWLSYFPRVKSWSGNYSLILLIDQYWCVYYDYPPEVTRQTYGVICSTQDELLNNAVIEAMYLDAELEYVDTSHSNIVDAADLYLNAIRNLLSAENAP